MDEYKGIINIIKNTQPVQSPDDFTERVMDRLPALQPSIWSRIKESFLRPRTTHMFRIFTKTPSRTECSFYFIMAGILYFITGIVLIMGLKNIGAKISNANWIMMQPQIAFITAFGLMVLGISLLKKNILIIKAAHFGVLIYIGFVIINGIVLQMSLNIPVSIVFILYFMCCGLLVGAFLAITIQRYLKNFVNAEV